MNRDGMKRSLRRAGSGAVALGLAVPLLAGAQAASAAGLPTYYSTTNAGYAVYSTSAPPAHVSARFNVPTISNCTGTDVQIGLGIGVQDGGGSGASIFVKLGCSSGTPVYRAEANMFGKLTVLTTPISPNDPIGLSATMTSAATRATITDKTTGYKKTFTGKADVAAYGTVTADPIHVPPVTGVLLGVPQFTKFSFTMAQVDGVDLGTYTAATGLYEFVRTTNGLAPPGGIVQIQPGAPRTASFPLAFKSH
jgi:hypothetical protein